MLKGKFDRSQTRLEYPNSVQHVDKALLYIYAT